jgi:hypothetical protein
MTKRRGSGDGSLHRAASGRWVATITIGTRGGHQLRRKRSARTHAEARTNLRELQEELKLGITSSKRLTVSAWLDEWVGRQEATGKKSAPTIANYHWAIDKHLKPALHNVMLDKLMPDDVDRLLGAIGRIRSS